MAGFLWGLATWMKWAPAPLWLILRPRARLWGLVWLAASVLLSLVTLPLTIVQLKTLFGFDRPALRLDYLVLLWALVPWLWRQPEPFAWLYPATWRRFAGRLAGRAHALAGLWRRDSGRPPVTVRREMYARVRAFLGLRA
jgi:hypothetical protein